MRLQSSSLGAGVPSAAAGDFDRFTLQSPNTVRRDVSSRCASRRAERDESSGRLSRPWLRVRGEAGDVESPAPRQSDDVGVHERRYELLSSTVTSDDTERRRQAGPGRTVTYPYRVRGVRNGRDVDEFRNVQLSCCQLHAYVCKVVSVRSLQKIRGFLPGWDCPPPAARS